MSLEAGERPRGFRPVLWTSVVTVLILPAEISYHLAMSRQVVIALTGAIWLAATALIMQFAIGPGQALP